MGTRNASKSSILKSTRLALSRKTLRDLTHRKATADAVGGRAPLPTRLNGACNGSNRISC